jgi:hypothetical protein
VPDRARHQKANEYRYHIVDRADLAKPPSEPVRIASHLSLGLHSLNAAENDPASQRVIAISE